MKKSSLSRICISGDGWAAKSAITSISKFYKNITIVTTDKSIISNSKNKKYKFSQNIFKVKADLFVCSGYKKILNKNFLDRNIVLNIHYSLLPKYRGLHSVIWAILNEEKYFGLTIHLMNEFIDDGPIIYQFKFKNIGQNSKQIIETCNKHVERKLSKIVNYFLNNKIRLRAQNKKQIFWVCKRNYNDCLINFDNSISFLELLFKALVEPYPLPQIKIKKKLIEIMDYELIKKNYYMTNGRVVNVQNENAYIKVSDGYLVVKKIRDANNKNEINVSKVLKVGMRL